MCLKLAAAPLKWVVQRSKTSCLVVRLMLRTLSGRMIEIAWFAKDAISGDGALLRTRNMPSPRAMSRTS